MKILVIEDEKSLAEAIKLKLSNKGFEVLTTALAEEGLEILKNNDDINFIWLDLRLPKMNGMDFLKILREDSQFKNTKVVIVSVSGDDEIKGKAHILGVSDYLVKSEFKLDDIIERVVKKI